MKGVRFDAEQWQVNLQGVDYDFALQPGSNDFDGDGARFAVAVAGSDGPLICQGIVYASIVNDRPIVLMDVSDARALMMMPPGVRDIVDHLRMRWLQRFGARRV